ncbi:MAG: VWA domain-containing protein [Verrucomicrobiota bacterium]
MNFQFTNPLYLLLLIPGLAWVTWLAWKSDVQISAWRRWVAFVLRVAIVLALVLAIAGLQWKKPLEGMNVFFLLDRSDSVPSGQQEAAKEMVNKFSAQKKITDKAGVLVFGTDAGIESAPNPAVNLQKIQAIIGTERTDIAGAIRLGTAAFPETGQKRLVLFSDGNENIGDAYSAMLAAKPLGVTLDVIPLGIARANDVAVQKLGLPSTVKKGQAFEVKIFAQADQAQSATLRLYRNEQFLGEQKVELAAGKNLFTFPQTLNEPGFYSYNVQLDSPGDLLPQNNRASSFVHVRGNPRVLVVSSEPKPDAQLVAALQSAKLEVKSVDVSGFPATLAEIQSYDTIFLSNVSAGDLGTELMTLLESSVRDFGVGLVCIGGDQTYAAGSYRGTPLEATLPVEMELNSKKVLPSGALVLVVHATEFPNGNQWARDIAFAALDSLGPMDQMGIVLWDGKNRWLFDLAKVGDKKEMGKQITGMNPGDMGDFHGPMQMAYDALKKSNANLKHMVVFSDGDPAAPKQQLVQDIVAEKITISTVMIGGHVSPETMTWMADQGRGRFYDVRSPGQLPQIFIKEAAVILKSAIFEEPFKPQLASSSEMLRGIGAAEYPQLRGYVCTTAKARAEIPLVTDKGDPLLAHWQYGLGRAVAFTSDAKAKWATDWIGWEKFRQFWSQVAQWSLRRVENSDFNTEVSVDKGEGNISVEAIDAQGNFRNFLNLQTVVVSPKGERQTVRLEQTGPGHYEAKFPTKEVGAYLMNLMDLKDGELRGSQILGASVNYSPEFSASEPNLNLLRRLAESGGGKLLEPGIDNPFLHNRLKTFQPRDLWEWLLKLAIILFPLDVAIRRIQLDREEWSKGWRAMRRWLLFWKPVPRPAQAEESLAALLSRRDEVRSRKTETRSPETPANPDLFRPKAPVKIEPEGNPAELVAETIPEPEKKPAAPENTTSRLLEAKRRARKNRE